MKMKNLFLKVIKQTGNYLERKYRGLKVEKFELIPDGTSGIRVAKFLVKCSYKPESFTKLNAIQKKFASWLIKVIV